MPYAGQQFDSHVGSTASKQPPSRGCHEADVLQIEVINGGLTCFEVQKPRHVAQPFIWLYRYYESALRIAPRDHWDQVITSYLAAPNVINM